MQSYDYCVLADSDLPDVLKKGALLGWDGMCLLNAGGTIEPSWESTIELVRGALIETSNANSVKTEAAKLRQGCESLTVRGMNEEVNRAAVETAAVDILLPAPGSKIDYVMVKLAKEKNVAIAFELGLLLQSSGVERSRIFSRMLEVSKIVRNFSAPFVLTSGAMSGWDLRSPSELTAFGRVLGFEEPRIKDSLSGNLAGKNRRRLSDKWIMPGVEVE